jgi:protein-disulfide isomerase
MKKEELVEKKVVVAETAPKKVDDSNDYITFDFKFKSLTLPWAIVLSAVVLTAGIGTAVFFGIKARPIIINTSTQAAEPDNTTFAATDFGEVSIKLSKGPIRGDSKAKVTILEFGDYICPYCQKFFTGSYPTIKAKYIDTKKVKIAYREFPLTIHDSAATESSLIGICLYQKAGNNAFNAYHDLMYANQGEYVQTINDKELVKAMVTKTGYTKDDLTQFDANWGGAAYMLDQAKTKTLLEQIGQNYKSMLNCSYSASAISKLRADQADFGTLNQMAVEKGYEANGIGTPAFVIGIVGKDGVLKGRLISGAYPIGAFEAVIEEMLAK